MRTNELGKWGRTNLWLDFVKVEAASAAVQHFSSFHQPDVLLGGIQWTLSSKHFSFLDEHSFAAGLGRLALEDATKRMADSRTKDEGLKSAFLEMGKHMDKMNIEAEETSKSSVAKGLDRVAEETSKSLVAKSSDDTSKSSVANDPMSSPRLTASKRVQGSPAQQQMGSPQPRHGPAKREKRL